MAIPRRKIVIGEFTWKRLVRPLLFIYAGLLLIAIFFSERLIFPYRGCSYSNDLPGLKILRTADGTRLATRFWKSPSEKFLVLFFHGNAEDLGHLDPIMTRLMLRGFSVLAMDYRGYGLSEGKVSERNCYEDARLLYREAQDMGYQPHQIIAWGRSVGGGLATELARSLDLRSLVLESAFTTAFRSLTTIPLFPFDRFNNLKKIKQVQEPLFVLHGDSDSIVPDWHSEKLFHRHSGRKERHLIPGAGHNDLWLHPLDPTLNALERFLSGSGG